jgi:hypothetical protein
VKSRVDTTCAVLEIWLFCPNFTCNAIKLGNFAKKQPVTKKFVNQVSGSDSRSIWMSVCVVQLDLANARLGTSG